MSTTLDIKIQGREYRVACAPEEVEALQAAADLLNAQMAEIAKATKSTGERLAVMTALNLANELNAVRRAAATGTAATTLGQAAAAAVSENSIDAEGTRRRIKAIEARLDEALSRQEKLF
jgi:cell division protein ZapA